MNRRKTRLYAVLFAGVAALLVAVTVMAEPPDADSLIKKADKSFEEKNYKDAAKLYETVAAAKPKHEKWHHASKRIIICRLRLQLFDSAIEAALSYIQR